MATLQDLLDDLNDRLNDADNDAGVGEVKKIRYINNGISAMWPRVYRTVADDSIELAAGTYEYAIPAAVGDEGEIFRVEIESTTTAGVFVELDQYDIVPLIDGRTLQFHLADRYDGAQIRIHAALPLRRLALPADVWDGRDIHLELPVWYALGQALARRIEDRTDYTRYATVDGRNGVDIDEQMGASQFAFAQFELLLERMAMPWPTSVG